MPELYQRTRSWWHPEEGGEDEVKLTEIQLSQELHLQVMFF